MPSDLHPDAQILSAAALARIQEAVDAGCKARAAVLNEHRDDDIESQLARDRAGFECAFQVLAVTLHELRASGIRGDRLTTLMLGRAEAAANSLGLGDLLQDYFFHLLEREWA